MNDKQNVLSNNIKYLRKKIGYNQEQLANALSINRSNIAAYEAKNIEPRLRIILEMSKLFDVDLRTFLQTKINDKTDLDESGKGNKEVKGNIINNSGFSTKVNIDAFVDKSVKIKKILIGLKSFHQFRRNNLKDRTKEQENILSDIDNFIMLMEHLLLNNENLINILNKQYSNNQA